VLDAADRRVHHRTAREARRVVHQVPQVLDVARILAHEPFAVILDHLDRRLVRPAGVRLADAFDALIGDDLHIDPSAAARDVARVVAGIAASGADHVSFDVDDLERRLIAHRRRGLRHRHRGSGGSRRQRGAGEKVTASHGGVILADLTAGPLHAVS